MTTTATSVAPRAAPGRRRWTLLDARLAPFVFLAPFMIVFLVFRIWPLVQAVEMSFQDVQGLQGNDWVGLENYQAIIEELIRAKPSAAKGKYIRTVTLASTQGPGIKIDPSRTKDLIETEAASAA